MNDAKISPDFLQTESLVVCVGTGGVGKTTISAAIAVQAAREGRRVLAITIDPAKRLSDSLGLGTLEHEPRALEGAALEAIGAIPGGRLSAMVIDMKRTFDDLIERLTDDEETRERILANRIYQHVSDTLAGSAEYAAMAKVYEMAQREEYDLIVVDTPPSQHALDFLDAPQRMMEFLDSRLVKTLVNPALSAGRLSLKLFQRTTGQIVKLMERVTGLTFLEDISEFLLIFSKLSTGYSSGANAVRDLLTRQGTSFLLVAGATPEAVRNAGGFLDRLTTSDIRLRSIILNRMRVWPETEAGLGGNPESGLRWLEAAPNDLEADIETLARELRASGTSEEEAEDSARVAVDVARRYANLARLDHESTASLRGRADELDVSFHPIPEFSRDVYDLDGLRALGGHLFDDSPLLLEQQPPA